MDDDERFADEVVAVGVVLLAAASFVLGALVGYILGSNRIKFPRARA